MGGGGGGQSGLVQGGGLRPDHCASLTGILITGRGKCCKYC